MKRGRCGAGNKFITGPVVVRDQQVGRPHAMGVDKAGAIPEGVTQAACNLGVPRPGPQFANNRRDCRCAGLVIPLPSGLFNEIAAYPSRMADNTYVGID